MDCSTPVTAGPNRSPTDSVAIEIAQASPPSATPATMKTTTGWMWAKWRTPVTTASPRIAAGDDECFGTRTLGMHGAAHARGRAEGEQLRNRRRAVAIVPAGG